MSKICQITGKRVMFGNNVSKSINKTRRRFDINLVKKRFFIPEQNKWVTLKVTTSVLKTINKKGISEVLRKNKKLIKSL
ncbi:MAG: 50S ribosomal protein L28 [Flavobacteriaceae bacterium]|jgi:large subunit ribosomal protein L28|nr:50S ribosomal protein L28 [Flavobacteriaceae bacterium]|tara:strand:- start:589 stop:825 length:237 start_codon:yes stop_codon:yes gene_type:complete